MCGIYGFEFIDEKLAKKLISQIKHRGPDYQEFKEINGITLGHARLSIIDLNKRSNQPFKYNNLTIVFNGEIYNFQEIRDKLIKKGYKFKTNSDTEVICASYQEWKEKCLDKFNGMFGFCIYDKKENKLFLARDRFGIKPLYYTKEKFSFCSELKPLTLILKKIEINNSALEEYFHIRFTIGEETIIKNIFKFKPGHFMIYDIKNKEIEKYENYYQIKVKKWNSDYKSAKNTLKKLMEKSIERRMISDVPVAAFLSGGLDSSIVSTLASKKNKNLNTFSIGFETTNELEYAKAVSQKINSNHKQFNTSQKDLKKHIDLMIEHIDEPIADPGFLPILYLSEQVKKHNKVVLSGDGADEIFCGYDRYKLFHYGKYLKYLCPIQLNPITKKLSDMRKSKTEGEEFFQIIRLFDDDELKKLGIKNIKKKILKKYTTNGSRLTNAMLFDMKTLMPNDFFMKSDKMSSAFGLEQRVPFMDHELVEFAFSLPDNYKLRLFSEKKILKDTFSSILPKITTKRKKHGFNVPIDLWIKSDLGDELIKLVKASNLSYNSKYILKLIEEAKQLKISKNNQNIANNFVIMQKLWAIYILEKWLKTL